MSQAAGRRPSAIVFGARNLGRAVIEALIAEGWWVTGVARSQATLDGVAAAGALPLQADVTDPASVYAALDDAAAAHGAVDLAVNATSAYGGDRSGPFGGGPIAEADLGGFDSWAAAPARSAFSFLSASARFVVAQGGPATLVQVTGGSARRAMAGRGLWSAGAFGVRAITNAAALELRPVGIHVALLIVDAGIQPLTGPARPGISSEALADPRRIADAVLFLANQGARSATHELQLTPLGETWTP
ncbi:MAG: family NAD(P)-dependent oxidoreductase [Solirubrobacterales bacterium]|nr:family NAD(P)-dependent oxidoreductase [Solirubrobacterales bacterium]